MRKFIELDQATVDAETGIISLTAARATEAQPSVSMRREGDYITISASYGLLEIALRPRYHELTRVLSRLQPVEGLQTTRQVGTGQAFLALGLKPDGTLLMRPTLVADATGHMSFNLALTDAARSTLYSWLPIETAPA
jgi:hypothetical protein